LLQRDSVEWGELAALMLSNAAPEWQAGRQERKKIPGGGLSTQGHVGSQMGE